MSENQRIPTDLEERVSRLVNTSVDDMGSSLHCSEVNSDMDITVLREALAVVIFRGEPTKARILQRYIRKLKSEVTA